MDEKKLLKYAVDYLSKYDSSKKNLLNVLKRKIYKLNLSTIDRSRLFNVLENILIKLEKNNINIYSYINFDKFLCKLWKVQYHLLSQLIFLKPN